MNGSESASRVTEHAASGFSTEVLLEQLEAAYIRRKTRRGVFRGNKRKAMSHALYKDPGKIVEHYRAWFAFCRTRGFEPLVVLPHAAMRCISVNEWERECVKGH